MACVMSGLLLRSRKFLCFKRWLLTDKPLKMSCFTNSMQCACALYQTPDGRNAVGRIAAMIGTALADDSVATTVGAALAHGASAHAAAAPGQPA